MTRPALVALAALALVACPSPEPPRSADAFGPFPSFESAADATIEANPCPAGTVPVAYGNPDRPDRYGAPYFIECPETCPDDPRGLGREKLRELYGRDAGDEIADAPDCPEARFRASGTANSNEKWGICLGYADDRAIRGAERDGASFGEFAEPDPYEFRAALEECLRSLVSGPYASFSEALASPEANACPAESGASAVAFGGSGAVYGAPYFVFCPL